MRIMKGSVNMTLFIRNFWSREPVRKPAAKMRGMDSRGSSPELL